MICKSLLGDLTEQDDGIFRSYEAKFMAYSPENFEQIDQDTPHFERAQLTIQNEQPFQNHVRGPLVIEEEKSSGSSDQ